MFRPRVDIYETEEGLVLAADLPGVAPDGLDIRLERRILTIGSLLGSELNHRSLLVSTGQLVSGKRRRPRQRILECRARRALLSSSLPQALEQVLATFGIGIRRRELEI